MHIVDRRLNPSGKNLANRQRFMRRAKSLIRKAVHESSASRSIKDADQGGEVALPAQGVHEPSFHRSAQRRHARPSAAGQQGIHRGRHHPAPAGRRRRRRLGRQPGRRGQDDFRFALSRDEFVDLFLEDLELPDLAKRRVVGHRERDLASRRLFGHRLAGQPRAAAHGAQQPVAPHRAEAAEAGGAAGAARRDRRAGSPDGDDRGASLALRGGARRASCAAPG